MYSSIRLWPPAQSCLKQFLLFVRLGGFIPADQFLLFLTLRTGRSTTLGLPDITVPEFSHRFDENQLVLSTNRKKCVINCD